MTVDLEFEREFERFVLEQQASATGLRLELLMRNLEGTKKMFRTVFWPILKSFDGFILEYEVVNSLGVRLFIDAYYVPLRIAFESEGFVVHAGNITREQFNRERARVRTLANSGYIYFPFSWDELDKNPEACRASVYELFGKYTLGRQHTELTLKERTLLKQLSMLNRPFRVADVTSSLNVSTTHARQLITSLVNKKLIEPRAKGKVRCHFYVVDRDEVTRRRVL